jgi:hypothetical protein
MQILVVSPGSRAHTMPRLISCASQSAVEVQFVPISPKQPARQVVPNSSVSAHIVATLPLPQTGEAGKQDTSPSQHVPAQQLPPFGHSPALSHLWRPTAASATFGVKGSRPPTRAAPNNLSALPRESVPLASPLASSSKVRLVVPWLTCAPFPKGRSSLLPHHAVRRPGYLPKLALCRRPLGFAPPPYDGFALLASAHTRMPLAAATFPECLL